MRDLSIGCFQLVDQYAANVTQFAHVLHLRVVSAQEAQVDFSAREQEIRQGDTVTRGRIEEFATDIPSVASSPRAPAM